MNNVRKHSNASKQSMMKSSVLSLSVITKPFKIHTDALGFALGEVLVQDK